MRVLLFWFLCISAVSVFVTVLDKCNARAHRRRVPENTLMLLSALGGSVAMHVTMRLIRHKTRHKKFMLGIPCIFVLQAVCLGLFYYSFQ